MSLATRCDACGTVFRVVQDQLKVSDGWVRCGRCHTVFDAQRGLFDLDRQTPPPWAATGLAGSVGDAHDADGAAAAIEGVAARDDRPIDPADATVTVDEFGSPTTLQADSSAAPGVSNLIVDEAAWPQESYWAGQDVDLSSLRIDYAAPADGFDGEPVGVPAIDGAPNLPPMFAAEPGAYIPNESRSSAMGRIGGDTPGDRVAPADRNDFADAQFSPSMLHDDSQNDGTLSAETEPDAQTSPIDSWMPEAASNASEDPSVPPDVHASDEAATPGFVRRARRMERWQSTESRVALAFVVVVATLALSWQALHQMRHGLVAQWPEVAPVISRYCGVVGCSAQALRRIDDVSIETTGLTQGEVGSGSLRLSVTLRNRAEVPLAMPSVDLSLTGVDGELVARRAFFPADFRTGNLPLKPGVDTSLLLNFSVTGRKVSGYTVEVFYP
jgi:predicted Zn finger-like uncharacterized protein